MMDGDRSILELNVDKAALKEVFRDEALVGNVEEFCAPPRGVDEEALDMLPCSAGHTACYVSPYGDVYPCVQFPLPTGNVRTHKVSGHLARFAAVQGSSVHHAARHAVVLQVHAWRNLHALPWVGLHGRKYARTFLPGLRKIVRAHRNSQREFQSKKRVVAVFPILEIGSDSRVCSLPGGIFLPKRWNTAWWAPNYFSRFSAYSLPPRVWSFTSGPNLLARLVELFCLTPPADHWAFT